MSTPNEDYERAVNLATEAVTARWALYRDPRYGTELLVIEVREIVAHAIKVFCEEVGDPTHNAQDRT